MINKNQAKSFKIKQNQKWKYNICPLQIQIASLSDFFLHRSRFDFCRIKYVIEVFGMVIVFGSEMLTNQKNPFPGNQKMT